MSFLSIGTPPDQAPLIWGQKAGVWGWYNQSLASYVTSVAPSQFATGRLYAAGGEATYDRALAGDSSLSPTSGFLMLMAFTALRTEACNNISIVTGGTAAGATPTLCRMGVYQIDTSGNFTLVAAIPNDTTLFSLPFTLWTRTFSSSFNKVAGVNYALGVVVVSSFTMPAFCIAFNLGGTNAFGTISKRLPMQGAIQNTNGGSGFADLPASFASSALAPGAGQSYFMEVLP